MILSKKQIIMALISLCRCAGWSVPLMFANPKDRFSHAQLVMDSAIERCSMTKMLQHVNSCYCLLKFFTGIKSNLHVGTFFLPLRLNGTSKYSKICIKLPLKKKAKTKILMTNGSLMKVKSIAECSPWPALSSNWS